jgi:hypothetical protein
VELIFNTRASRGRVNKNAKITSNDTAKPSFSIDFTAQIIPEPDTISAVRYSPTRLEFDKDSRKMTVTVENHDNTATKLGILGSMADDVTAKIKDDVIKAGKTGKLEFQWKGDTLPEYDEEHVITFETGIRSIHRFSIPYVIKGQKGSKSGAPAKHAKTPENKLTTQTTANETRNTAGQTNKSVVNRATAQSSKPATGQSSKPAAGQSRDIYQQYNPDSVNVDKPLPGAHQWPPR